MHLGWGSTCDDWCCLGVGADPRGQDTLVLPRRQEPPSGWHDRSVRWLREGSPHLHARTPASLTASRTLVPSTHTAPHSFSDTPGLPLWDQRCQPGLEARALQGDKQAASSCGSRESCAQQTEVKLACWPVLRARGGEGVKTGLEMHHSCAAGSSHHPSLPPLPPSSRGQCSQGRHQCLRGSRAHGEKLVRALT